LRGRREGVGEKDWREELTERWSAGYDDKMREGGVKVK
jgi:hypothetical protein